MNVSMKSHNPPPGIGGICTTDSTRLTPQAKYYFYNAPMLMHPPPLENVGTLCSIHVMDTSLKLLVQSPRSAKKFETRRILMLFKIP